MFFYETSENLSLWCRHNIVNNEGVKHRTTTPSGKLNQPPRPNMTPSNYNKSINPLTCCFIMMTVFIQSNEHYSIPDSVSSISENVWSGFVIFCSHRIKSRLYQRLQTIVKHNGWTIKCHMLPSRIESTETSKSLLQSLQTGIVMYEETAENPSNCVLTLQNKLKLAVIILLNKAAHLSDKSNKSEQQHLSKMQLMKFELKRHDFK